MEDNELSPIKLQLPVSPPQISQRRTNARITAAVSKYGRRATRSIFTATKISRQVRGSPFHTLIGRVPHQQDLSRNNHCRFANNKGRQELHRLSFRNTNSRGDRQVKQDSSPHVSDMDNQMKIYYSTTII